MALAPLKAMKRGAQSTPGSARPTSRPPLGREEGECHRGQGTGVLRPHGPEETAPAAGAMPPPADVDLGGAVRPAQVTEGRAIVASDTAPEAPRREGRAMPDGVRAPYSGPILTTQREGPDSFWTTRRRITSGRVWTCAGVPVSRPSTELLSS